MCMASGGSQLSVMRVGVASTRLEVGFLGGAVGAVVKWINIMCNATGNCNEIVWSYT